MKHDAIRASLSTLKCYQCVLIEYGDKRTCYAPITDDMPKSSTAGTSARTETQHVIEAHGRVLIAHGD